LKLKGWPLGPIKGKLLPPPPPVPSALLLPPMAGSTPGFISAARMTHTPQHVTERESIAGALARREGE
jgi:hypothetical protein